MCMAQSAFNGDSFLGFLGWEGAVCFIHCVIVICYWSALISNEVLVKSCYYVKLIGLIIN